MINPRWLRIGIGVWLSLLALVWLMRQIELEEVWHLLQTASPFYVGVGLFSVGINFFAKVLRWRVLLGEQAETISGRTLIGVMLSGQLMNAVVPGRVGDLTRIFFIGRLVGKVFVLGTIVLEKWFDTLFFALLIVGMFLWVPVPSWMSESSYGASILILFGSVGAFCVVYYAEVLKDWLSRFVLHLPEQPRIWIWTRLKPGLASLAILRKKKQVLRPYFGRLLYGELLF